MRDGPSEPSAQLDPEWHESTCQESKLCFAAVLDVGFMLGVAFLTQNWGLDQLSSLACLVRVQGSTFLDAPGINRVRASTRWVITDHNFKEVCANPFRPMQTEIGLLVEASCGRVIE